jgi:transcription initiation factor IIE alpha subunit
MKCKSCGEDVEELQSVRVRGRTQKLCEACVEELAEQAEIADAAESAMQGMMEYKGRR